MIKKNTNSSAFQLSAFANNLMVNILLRTILQTMCVYFINGDRVCLFNLIIYFMLDGVILVGCGHKIRAFVWIFHRWTVAILEAASFATSNHSIRIVICDSLVVEITEKEKKTPAFRAQLHMLSVHQIQICMKFKEILLLDISTNARTFNYEEHGEND